MEGTPIWLSKDGLKEPLVVIVTLFWEPNGTCAV